MAAYLKRTASAEMRSAQYRQMGRRRRRRVLLFPLLLGLMLFLGGFMLGAARAVVEEQEEPAVEALTRSPASAVEAQPLEPAEVPAEMPEAAVEEDAWQLRLVSAAHPLPEDFEVPELTKLKGGHAIDSRVYPALQQMMDDCRADGLNPYICASYRTMKKQKALFADKVRRVLLEGCPKDEAEDEAAKTVARPGTSEHQLGLALDIVDADDPRLETWQEDTPVQQWLMKNSWKYGFVLRYPPEKSSITGIIYEPWHYRYVGRQAAEEMHNKGLCLEEYLKEREEG